MFLLDHKLCWSASDLSSAAECEYAVLRKLDYLLGWAADPDHKDRLMERIAWLGDQHEAKLLAQYEAAGQVIKMERVKNTLSVAELQAGAAATRQAFLASPSMVYQATWFDGEFFGYADFIEATPKGWLVCDAKLARSARPKALLQLGAYVEQLLKLGLPVAPEMALLLGNGERAGFRVTDVLPVFRERRARLLSMLAAHRAGGTPVAWGDERHVACGRCPECEAAALAANDVILVARLRMEQRRKLRDAGILTVGDLAQAAAAPKGMAPLTFANLKAQAAMQWAQIQAGPDAPVSWQLIEKAPTTLSLLPAPSEGDLFFDFEGDPLYGEEGATRTGLEYLWGITDSRGTYTSYWAHDWREEKDTFVRFIRFLAERRARYPDMHVYHYAPYETTALKRLMAVHQVMQDELDDLLRGGVCIDLYATVRGSVRASTSSYSIKEIEPLYMGTELRKDDGVQSGDASIVAYHEFREARDADPERARAQLKDLEDYNQYDCRSTLRLRDWLVQRAADVGVQLQPKTGKSADEESKKPPPALSPWFDPLMAQATASNGNARTAHEQGFAMVAATLNYHRLERNVFWWEHFSRLQLPLDEWDGTRDVFTVQTVEVVRDWGRATPRARTDSRTLRLTGAWAEGSKRGDKPYVVYEIPKPPGVFGPEGAPYGAGSSREMECDPADSSTVLLTEGRDTAERFPEWPVALAPPMPPNADKIVAAIERVAAMAVGKERLPKVAIFDLLLREPPRLRDGGVLSGDSTVANIVAALLGMDDSYVAVQGPPGTGKTYTGARVIKELVEKHRWRIGVVAQSHAVVENMLEAIVKAGLDSAMVGKSNNNNPSPPWTDPGERPRDRLDFFRRQRGTGCVLGGTAWVFTDEGILDDEKFDLLVIDEAGQFSLANTVGVSACANRLLLLGDPQQLPQVSQGIHGESIDESALGWLMEGHDTIPPDKGFFLGTSFRMHPELSVRVSTLSYEGKLKSDGKASRRHLDGVAPGLAVVQVDHVHNRTDSIEEVREVVAQVQAHMGKLWNDGESGSIARPLRGEDFLVVAPYNAQVGKLRKELDALGLDAVRVGTVDKFQGQEAPVCIVSMASSSHGDVPRGMGFLLNRNRLNVAISRAQWKAILVRSTALTSYMPANTNELLELGAFIGLCRPD